MKITDLYQVAKLGNKIDEDNYIKFIFTKEIDSFFEKFSDVFLVFKDYNVRYVTIDDVKYNRGYKVKLLEKELYDDIISDGKVKVCLEKKDVPNLPPELFYENFAVYDNDDVIGKVVGVLNGKFNEIFEINLYSGQEITVPNVEHFVRKIDIDDKKIYLKNFEELKELL